MNSQKHPSLRLHATTNDPRHQLAMAHIDLIDKLMAKNSFVYACAFLEPADFYQAGYVALYNAADKYDKAENAGFRTYASKAIHNAFLSLVRDSESVVRKPRDCEDAVYFDSLDQMSQSGMSSITIRSTLSRCKCVSWFAMRNCLTVSAISFAISTMSCSLTSPLAPKSWPITTI